MNRYEVALYVLAVGAIRNYGWLVFDPALRGSASKALGGLAMLAMVPLLYKLAPSRIMMAVLAWWSFEALQTTICSVAYMVEPWVVAEGQSICSARLDFDLGAIGITCVAFLLLSICKVLQVPGSEGVGRK